MNFSYNPPIPLPLSQRAGTQQQDLSKFLTMILNFLRIKKYISCISYEFILNNIRKNALENKNNNLNIIYYSRNIYHLFIWYEMKWRSELSSSVDNGMLLWGRFSTGLGWGVGVGPETSLRKTRCWNLAECSYTSFHNELYKL